LGDSVMATTVIEPLRARFGDDVEIDFACGPGASAAVLRLDRRVRCVFPITRRRIHWRLNPSKAALRDQARARPYDLVVNLECGSECDDFSRFLDYRRFCGRPLDRPCHAPDRHNVDTEKGIYRELLGPEATDAATPEILMEEHALPAPLEGCGKFLLVNAGFSGMGRTGYRAHRGWPSAHWQSLIGRIQTEIGWTVVVNGTESERSLLEPLLSMNGVRSFVGSGLEDLLSALRRAECVVSVDTGTMHLAAALGTPLVALFGPTWPAMTGPYPGLGRFDVLTSGVECQPCAGTRLQKQCTLNRCMREITPDFAFDAVRRLVSDQSEQARPLAAE
jgi:ADP-heptose:LPS heptosyltransferase